MLAVVMLALWAHVVAAVRITEHPSPVSVPEGAPGTLHCRTSPPAAVVWEREGRPVPASEGVLALPDGSLFLLSTTARDAGRYRCRAGTARSRPALLEVRFLRSAFGAVDRAVRAAEGGLALLPCLAPRGRPQPAVRWERDGRVVKGRRVEGGALVLEGVGLEDGGAYTCVAANSEGEERDAPVELVGVLASSTTHEVVLVERQEEELSLRVWAVAVALAVVVTLALLALALLVCLRYRRLALPPPELPGDGGSSEQGMFNPDTVAKMGEDCPMIKEAGYEGVVFDVEVTRGGMLLVDTLEEAFKKCKAADLVVMVTTSHTAPTGVSLGDIRLKLIESWVKSDNLDIISPQLYTWGGEEEPEFDSTWPCDNCTFNKYKGSKAQFMPSVVNGDHMKAVKKYFDKLKIPVSGYFQWQPVLSASDQEKADEAAKAEEEYAKEHADDQEQEEEAPEEEDPPEYDEGQSPVELAIKEDQAAGWLTDAEVKAAMKEYKEMHEKGWAVDAK
jgi:hypothetical protein